MLDAILERLVEREEPLASIVAAGFDREVVTRIDRLLNIAEYKRRQAAPGVKVTQPEFRARSPLSHHQQVSRYAASRCPNPTRRWSRVRAADRRKRSRVKSKNHFAGIKVGPTERIDLSPAAP